MPETGSIPHEFAGKGRLPDLARTEQRGHWILPQQAREIAEMGPARDSGHA